jgi:iron complex transport system permease protein
MAASVGSWLALGLVWLVSNRFRGLASLLIFGLMLNYVLGALVTVLQAEAREKALQQFVIWGMGTFGQATLFIAGIVLVLVLVSTVLAFNWHRDLDKWTMGEITARSMGVDESRLRRVIIVLTGLLAGSITAVCGPVAFLGLATPHLVKLLTPHRSHRRLIPMTALVGALLALVADWGVKGLGIFDGGWPLNAVLSLLGAPMVVWVLIQRNFSHS